ncbi:MAG: hypothetical protein PHC84_03000, partial [Clostridia bacterium]|nr:hypothetical protein [Clostridia bacterium]
MLKEIVGNIIEAEKAAEKTVAEALWEAKEMNNNAVAEAERIRNDAVRKVREERQMVIETARNEAEDSYNEIIVLGKKHAEKILRQTATTEAV